MSTVPNTGIIHVGFNTKDLDAALAFYCGALGMPVLRQLTAPADLPEDAPLYPLRGKPFITYLQAGGGVVLELFSPLPGRDENRVTGNSIGFTHLALGVPDMNAALEALRAIGAQIDSVPENGGGKAAWIRDPDGNRIEVMQTAQS